MADTLGFTIIKHALLAPLQSVSKAKGQNENPRPLNATSYVDVHDHHNIEIKTVSDLGSAPSFVETDIFLFVPRSFEITNFEKTEITRDFRTRMRLSAPVSGEQGLAAFESALSELEAARNRLEDVLSKANHIVDLADPMCEALLESTRDLCAVVTGSLKHSASEETRNVFLSHSVFTTEDSCLTSLRRISEKASQTFEIIARLRAQATSKYSAPDAIFAILDEYVSQAYVQYLGTVRAELERIRKPDAFTNSGYELERARTLEALDRLQKNEAKYRLRFGACASGEETDIDRERRLLRMSQLKKFFQSKSFVDVSRQHPAKRFSESTALIGTAGAAALAAFVQEASMNGMVAKSASHAFVVMSLGVLVYVLRDRLKDRAKETLRQQAMKILPDSEQILVAQENRIGAVKEWFRVRDSKDLPVNVQGLRRAACVHEMEKRLPEDVLHCRRTQEVDASMLAGQGGTTVTRSLHENTRINFERYLKHMDDPFKELTDLDPSGRFSQSLSHRVYHFHLCVKTTSRPQENKWTQKLLSVGAKPGSRLEQTLIYRIVLDKNGIVRIEDLVDLKI